MEKGTGERNKLAEQDTKRHEEQKNCKSRKRCTKEWQDAETDNRNHALPKDAERQESIQESDKENHQDQEDAEWEIVHAQDFSDWQFITSQPKIKRRGRKAMLDLVMAFDIETTALDDIREAIMYVWQWEVGNRYCIIGRTWDEFKMFIDRLVYELDSINVVALCFVHNLSYEIQWLESQLDWSDGEIFCTDPRRVLSANYKAILEFRCSMFLTNMSLDMFTRTMKVKHTKLTGTFDYSKKRYPWTELDPVTELPYCVNDVRGLVEAVQAKMRLDGDTLATLPKTSTGYVRRDVQQAMRRFSFNAIKSLWPDSEIFTMLREAFRGGACHCNRYYAGITLENVTTYDRSSSYPDVMLNHLFPMTPFVRTGPMSPEDLDTWMISRGKAVLMRVAFTNIRLKDIFWGFPYLRRDKCHNLDQAYCDNGAVLQAGYLETTITDVDFRIITDEYSYTDMCITDGAVSTYGQLPDPLRDVIRDYYTKKTALKGLSGIVDGVDVEMLYYKVKALLNAIYGMCATNPAKDDIIYKNGQYFPAGRSIEELLERNGKRPFLSYAWSPWITAFSRLELERGLKLVGADAVYCDTDSVKFLGQHDFSTLNAEKMLDSTLSGAYAADANGEIHYMGVWEMDGKVDKWRGLGAKKYCSETDGKITLTLSGVTKRSGGDYLKERGGIDAFDFGFEFIGEEVAGIAAVYRDHLKPIQYEADGHIIDVPRNVYLQPSKYVLSAPWDYTELIKRCRQLFEYRDRNHDACI